MPAKRTTCAPPSSKRKFAEYGGYTAEARAGELLLGAGHRRSEQHNGPMSEVAPGWKLRVLLAQALFSNPDILLLDEPTNNLDINSIRWLEGVLNDAQRTMIIISPRPAFPEPACARTWPTWTTAAAGLPRQLRRLHAGLDAGARSSMVAANAKAKDQIADLQEFVRRFSANASKARQATSRAQADREDQDRGRQALRRARTRTSASSTTRKKLHGSAVEVEGLASG